MNSTLATEATPQAAEKATTHHPLLESWAHNERMRHVPVVGWIAHKLDVDLRRRIDKLWAPYAALAADHPMHATIEAELRAVCKAISHLADVARHRNGHHHPPHDLAHRLPWELNHAVSNLDSLDPNLIGRRFPFHTFERSKAEPLYAALVVLIRHVERLTELVRQIDPGIDEKLLEGLVVLSNPVDERMLRPIA